MKKFLLVLLIGLVLAFNIYGIINENMVEKEQNIDHVEETTITVYME